MSLASQLRERIAPIFWRSPSAARAQRLLYLIAAHIDAFVCAAWQRAQLHDTPCQLFALGGYGQRMMFPCSDIDILIIADAGYAKHVETFNATLWDGGWKIGQRVINAAALQQTAAADCTFATALLDARTLTRHTIDWQQIHIGAWSWDEFIQAKQSEQYQRHTKFAHSSYSLEPNIKHAPGGMRDMQTVLWLLQHNTFHNVDTANIIRPAALQRLNTAADNINMLRLGLHLLAENPRGNDRLSFEYQRQMSTMFGFQDGRQLAVEQMMKKYYRDARACVAINANTFQACEEYKHRKTLPQQRKNLDAIFYCIGNTLNIRHVRLLEMDPANLMLAFWHLATTPAVTAIHSQLAQHLFTSRHLINHTVRNNNRVNQLFVEILLYSEDISHHLELMSRYGILSRYIPAFGRVSGQMQHDLFHVYTVDAHTLQVVAMLQKIQIDKKLEDSLSLVSAVMRNIERYDMLVIAALFHDIAKGRGGDHSVLGAVDVAKFTKQHGYSKKQSATIMWLVRQHLTFSYTAQHSDISDPWVIEQFCKIVRTKEHLDYLYILTVADVNATNPTLWTSWRATLFDYLYRSTLKYLHTEIPNTRNQQIIARKKSILEKTPQQHHSTVKKMWSTLPTEYFLNHTISNLHWQTENILLATTYPLAVFSATHDNNLGATRIFIHHQDRSGLLRDIFYAIDKQSFNIQDARIITSTTGLVYDTFIVLDETNRPVAPERYPDIAQELINAILYGSSPSERWVQRSKQQFWKTPKIQFNENAHGGTTLQLICSNISGLLAAVTQIIFDLNFSIQRARVSTLGENIEDSFDIKNNGKPLDPDQQQQLRRLLIATLNAAHDSTTPPTAA